MANDNKSDRPDVQIQETGCYSVQHRANGIMRFDQTRSTILLLLIFGILSSGCSQHAAKSVSAIRMQKPITLPSISLEIPPGQQWPNDIGVKLLCDAPAEPTKSVSLTSLNQSQLASVEQVVRESQHRAEELRQHHVQPTPLESHFFRRDADILLVITQKSSVKPHEEYHFELIEPSPIGQIIGGQRNVLPCRLRRDQFLPGWIEVYALWIEHEKIVATSPVVTYFVEDGNGPADFKSLLDNR